jgi:hypothetical protein
MKMNSFSVEQEILILKMPQESDLTIDQREVNIHPLVPPCVVVDEVMMQGREISDIDP